MECYANMLFTTAFVQLLQPPDDFFLLIKKAHRSKKKKKRQTFSPTLTIRILHPPLCSSSLLLFLGGSTVHGLALRTLGLQLLFLFGVRIYIPPTSIQSFSPVLLSWLHTSAIVLWKNLDVVPALTPDTTLTQGVCGAELLLVAALGSGVSADRFPGTRLLEYFLEGAGGFAEDL